MQWEGENEPGLHLHLLPAKGWTNHARSWSFAQHVEVALQQEKYDVVIGFNKMPHLDVYFAADVCYQARVTKDKLGWYRLLPRYQIYTKLESAVFAHGNKTEIMLISPQQQSEYTRVYQTEPSRFHLLPPGISRDRIAPSNANDIREEIRHHYSIPNDHFILLMVGSGFKTKGVNRSILALADMRDTLKQRCHLWIIGEDNPKTFLKLARQKHIDDQVKFFGGRHDVPELLIAADLLLHPAYHENTGTVLLEAMLAGLPVLTTDVCGYAHYVQEAQAGKVLTSPFLQEKFNIEVENMLTSPEREQWQQNGLAFAKHEEIFQLVSVATNLIEQIGKQK
ncbi:MAG: hypothetical protein ACD_46C00567G0001 [uncultured bacterium]|nr:MAG: hypothetical protein ACD_46C00567G0001 [uncultured bacterium]